MNEKQLIHSAGKGDKEAFAKLYGLYKDRLYRYAYYRLGNSCDAEDAVCDTVLMAFEEIRDLRKASAFSAWIFRMHYSTCSKYVIKLISLKRMRMKIVLLNEQHISVTPFMFLIQKATSISLHCNILTIHYQ